nr:hypothetical protein Itr_chr01CG09160 [Ipomoea trifida]
MSGESWDLLQTIRFTTANSYFTLCHSCNTQGQGTMIFHLLSVFSSKISNPPSQSIRQWLAFPEISSSLFSYNFSQVSLV